MQPNLSIIIVHYQHENLTLGCIDSVLKYTYISPLEVIVVDNSPDENFKKLLAERLPGVVYFHMGYNSGFGRANNKGLKLAQGEFVLLLNNDTILSNNAIGEALSFYKQNRWAGKKGILTIRQVNENGTLNYSAYPDFPGIGKYLKANPIIIWLNRLRAPEAERKRRKLEAFHSGSRKAKWVSGAFMLFPKKLADDHHPFFDPQFFMYSEDVELCHRLYQRGYSHFYFHETCFQHLDGGSKENSLQRTGQIYLSEWLYFRMRKGFLYLWVVFKVLSLNYFIDSRLAKRKNKIHPLEYNYLFSIMRIFQKGILNLTPIESEANWFKNNQ